MTGQLRPFTGPKLKPLVNPAAAAAAASWSTVTPFVYFGQIRGELRRVEEDEAKKRHQRPADDPDHGEVGDDLVERLGRLEHDPANQGKDDESGDQPGDAGDVAGGPIREPEVRVVEEVGAGPDSDDPAPDLRAPDRLNGLELEERDRGEHQSPALEPAQQRADPGHDPAGEHVVAARAWHHARQRGEDKRKQDAQPAHAEGDPRPVRQAPDDDDRDPRQGGDLERAAHGAANEGGGVEEERVGYADFADESR